MNKEVRTIAIMVAWNIISDDKKRYLIAYTHYTYLEYISENYSKVYLLSSVKGGDNNSAGVGYNISDFNNVIVVPLPEVKSYLRSLLNICVYYKAVVAISKKVNFFYCRVPDPFAWMPRLITGKKTIMHFVGDAIDATLHNERWSFFRKTIMIVGYLPDYMLILLAAHKSQVYTNGAHLEKKLSRFGVKATAVISSTVSEKSLTQLLVRDNSTQLKLIYVGYIRYAKGIKLLMRIIPLLKEKYPDFLFHIVGDGEMATDLRTFIEENSLSDNVIMHGHIDNRETINSLMHSSDLFIFPSLSEGSPRVIIEAMSQGLSVVSTPVGSLPSSFVDSDDIRFFDFNDFAKVICIVDEYVHDSTPFDAQRNRAYQKIKNNYTIESLLSKIFNYET